jgi:hypothetical protein
MKTLNVGIREFQDLQLVNSLSRRLVQKSPSGHARRVAPKICARFAPEIRLFSALVSGASPL